MRSKHVHNSKSIYAFAIVANINSVIQQIVCLLSNFPLAPNDCGGLAHSTYASVAYWPLYLPLLTLLSLPKNN